MSHIEDGYQNEFLFVLEFNNKKVKELNPLLREVIDDLFPNINENSIIKSWRNHINNQKADIFIKINNIVRSISIKKGSRNSIHVESLDSFTNFLRLLGVNEKSINTYIDYHRSKMTSKEYINENKELLNDFNNEIKKIEMFYFINRFLLKGKLSMYPVDGLIYGTPNDFFWLNEKELYNIVDKSKNKESNSPHIGCFFIQPMNRCLNGNTTYLRETDYVQIKWYSLFDDILMYKAFNE